MTDVLVALAVFLVFTSAIYGAYVFGDWVSPVIATRLVRWRRGSLRSTVDDSDLSELHREVLARFVERHHWLDAGEVGAYLRECSKWDISPLDLMAARLRTIAEQQHPPIEELSDLDVEASLLRSDLDAAIFSLVLEIRADSKEHSA